MTPDEIRELYPLYVLGVLEEQDRSEIQEYLARHPEEAVEQARAMSMVSGLSTLAPITEPPRRLRRRVLASIGVTEAGAWGWMPAWAVAAALAIVVVGWIGVRERQRSEGLRQELAEARQIVGRQGLELTRLHEVMNLLNSPETLVRVSAEGQAAPPQAKVFLHPTQGVLLIASNLPQAPAGKIYEMWVIPSGGKPVPAGLFQSAANGTAIHLQRGSVNLATTAVIAVTLEPAGGVPQPTTTPLIVAPMKRS